MTSTPESRANQWPDERPFSGASYERVNCTVACVITRFQLRSRWSMHLFRILFRRVRRQALKQVTGFIDAVFMVENSRVCYVMSLWTDDRAILDFGTFVTSHVRAANRAFRHTFRDDLSRAEIWSTQWRLWALGNNLNWMNIDLRSILIQQGHLEYRRESVYTEAGNVARS